MINDLGFTCPVCKLLWRQEALYRAHLENHSDNLQLAYYELAQAAVVVREGDEAWADRVSKETVRRWSGRERPNRDEH